MYVAVKGGEQAIDNAHALLAKKRRGDVSEPELSVAQIRHQMPLAVARVMGEGSLFDEELAALAIKQSAGDLLRSEEHTSELQSIMRSSYAVFCLKKKRPELLIIHTTTPEF